MLVRLILVVLLFPTISFAAITITDDFSSDTSSNYWSVLDAAPGGIIIGSGYAVGSTDYGTSWAVHETSLHSSNHYVQAKLQYKATGPRTTCVSARTGYHGQTGYLACLSETAVTLYKINYTTITSIGTPYEDTFTEATYYTIKLTANNDLLSVDVDGTNRISEIDTTYRVGTHVGLRMSKSTTAAAPRVDDFVASSPDAHVPTDCTLAEVQAGIDGASDGDTVYIPNCDNGTVLWTSPLYIEDKNITLRGLNDCSSGPVGYLSNIPTSCPTNINFATGTKAAIYVYDSTKAFRIAHLNIVNNVGTTTSDVPIIHIQKMTNNTSATSNWRIDHVMFTLSPPNDSTGFSTVTVYGYQEGLIDHVNYNLAETEAGGNRFLFVLSGESESGADINHLDGANSWNRDIEYGSSHTIYVEDSYMYFGGYGSATDGRSGSSFVIRYCDIDDKSSSPAIESHPGCWAGTRGTRYMEIYNNYLHMPSGSGSPHVKIRGGTGLIYNNYLVGGGTDRIMVDDARTNCGVAPCSSSACIGLLASRCDGNSSLDGNTEGELGWPCLDQIGIGKGLPGSQTRVPVFVWGNVLYPSMAVFNTVSLNGGYSNINPSQADHLQKDRDWCEHDTSSACDGISVTYSAYTYPHPLQGIANSHRGRVTGNLSGSMR